MIRTVRVENYKSIAALTMELGRVNVLIGANGSGKSNILEALALASAAVQDKLDNEFLATRGIRVCEPRFMRSAFSDTRRYEDVKISVQGDGDVAFLCEILPDESASYPKLHQRESIQYRQMYEFVKRHWDVDKIPPATIHSSIAGALLVKSGALPGFLVYAPENSALRTFQAEGQILPLGLRGEGLFAHLKALSSAAHRERLVKIKDRLSLIDWFESFDVPEDLSPGERSIRIRDRYLPEGALFDQRSANEGFLFLLFYLTLFISPDTPAFFSIDNVDSSLNPKLCIALLQQIVTLAREHDKQVILTTHNPAILDGLDLHDDEQRLLVVDRNKLGHTRVHRVEAPKPAAGQLPVSLSEAFMRGYVGGLPKNF